MFGLAVRSGSSTSGAGVVICTVAASTACTADTDLGLNDRAGTLACSRWLSAPATAWASITVPSWNFTSLRRVNFHTVGLTRVQDSASHGIDVPSALLRVNVSEQPAREKIWASSLSSAHAATGATNSSYTRCPPPAAPVPAACPPPPMPQPAAVTATSAGPTTQRSRAVITSPPRNEECTCPTHDVTRSDGISGSSIRTIFGMGWTAGTSIKRTNHSPTTTNAGPLRAGSSTYPTTPTPIAQPTR